MIKWFDSTHERYWSALECLPPAARTRGGFLLGEPYDHNRQGEPLYTAYMVLGDEREGTAKYFEAVDPMTVHEFSTFPIADMPNADNIIDKQRAAGPTSS